MGYVEPEPPILPRLHEVRAPTLVVNGLSDVRYLQDLSSRLAEGIPGARRIDLPDTGHLPPVERPDAVNAALLEFLAHVASACEKFGG